MGGPSDDTRAALARALAKPPTIPASRAHAVSVQVLPSTAAVDRISQRFDNVSRVATTVNAGFKIPAFEHLKKLDIGGLAAKQMFAQSGSLSNALKLTRPRRAV